MKGAQETIANIKNNKPVPPISEASSQITGIEAAGSRCGLAYWEEFEMEGREAALRWYAARGIYAVNSCKYQKEHSVCNPATVNK